MKNLLIITLSLIISTLLATPTYAQQKEKESVTKSSSQEVRNNRESTKTSSSSTARSSSSSTARSSSKSTSKSQPSHADDRRGDRREPQAPASRPDYRYDRNHHDVPHSTHRPNSRPNSRPTVLPSLPSKHVIKSYKGTSYHIHDGRFYLNIGSGFRLTIPPIGFRVSVLPMNYLMFNFNNKVFYSYAGVVYRQLNRSTYEVVAPQKGMIVPELPEVNVSEVMIDGMIYFEFDGILYKQIPTRYGLQYEVVGELRY